MGEDEMNFKILFKEDSLSNIFKKIEIKLKKLRKADFKL
jgi:hypothetical protein